MSRQYASLMKRYKEQSSEDIFAHFGYKGQDGESWEAPYERLSRIAKQENWNFNRVEFQRSPYPGNPGSANVLGGAVALR